MIRFWIRLELELRSNKQQNTKQRNKTQIDVTLAQDIGDPRQVRHTYQGLPVEMETG